jgi:hypothetical protein
MKLLRLFSFWFVLPKYNSYLLKAQADLYHLFSRQFCIVKQAVHEGNTHIDLKHLHGTLFDMPGM